MGPGRGACHIVQSRPVTALPEPAADPPTTWPLPEPGLYSRASIVEQMPDPLTPLFADLIDGSVSRSPGALMAQAFGVDVLEPGDIALPPINGYAHYRYRVAAFRRVTVQAPAAVRALLGFSGDPSVVGGVVGWRERSHPRYVATVGGGAAKDVAALPSAGWPPRCPGPCPPTCWVTSRYPASTGGSHGARTLLGQEVAALSEMLARARRWPWVVAAALLWWRRRTRT